MKAAEQPSAPWTLLPLSAAHVELLVELDSDPEVMRHINGGTPTPRETYVSTLLPRMLSQAESPGLGFFLVFLGGEFVGWVHLRRDTFEPAWAEIGYRLKRAVWGQGLATDLSRSLVKRAFEALDFTTVSARTVPENAASRRVMEKAGLTFAGGFEYPGRTLPGLVVPTSPGVLYTRQRWGPTQNYRPHRGRRGAGRARREEGAYPSM